MRRMTQLMKTSLFALSALAALSAVTTMAHADDNGFKSPMIEVGGGAESNNASTGANVLVKVGVGFRVNDTNLHGFQPIGTEQTIWLHISGEGAIGVVGGRGVVPYLNIKASVNHSDIQLSQDDSGITYLNGRFVNVDVKRDISIDQDLMIRASVVKVELGKALNPEQAFSLYGQLGADLIGYKMAAHVAKDIPTFKGLHIATATAEGGVNLRIASEFSIKLAVGGSADINWNMSATNSRFQSDLNVYAALRFTITKFFEVFAQAGLNGFWDSGNAFAGGSRIMGGVTFLY